MKRTQRVLQAIGRPHLPEAIMSLVKSIKAGGHVVNVTEANTKESLFRTKVKILRHRREIRRKQRKQTLT